MKKEKKNEKKINRKIKENSDDTSHAALIDPGYTSVMSH